MKISVQEIDYVEGGHTLWVQGLEGTVLRLKTIGKIATKSDCNSPSAHVDVMVDGDIEICVPQRAPADWREKDLHEAAKRFGSLDRAKLAVARGQLQVLLGGEDVDFKAIADVLQLTADV